MTVQRNHQIIDIVKDITAARVSSMSNIPNGVEADEIAKFMQVIYDKLVDLDSKVTKD